MSGVRIKSVTQLYTIHFVTEFKVPDVFPAKKPVGIYFFDFTITRYRCLVRIQLQLLHAEQEVIHEIFYAFCFENVEETQLIALSDDHVDVFPAENNCDPRFRFVLV